MPIPVITVLFIKPVDFVHIKERFYKKKLVYLIVAMHQPSDGEDREV
jgi:hypothetical protein